MLYKLLTCIKDIQKPWAKTLYSKNIMLRNEKNMEHDNTTIMKGSFMSDKDDFTENRF